MPFVIPCRAGCFSRARKSSEHNRTDQGSKGKEPILPDDPADMAIQAKRCRRLASNCADQQTSEGVNQLAEEYERRAAKQEGEEARAT
jgi:hypothetical protein